MSFVGGLYVSILADAYHFSLALISSADEPHLGTVEKTVPFTYPSIEQELGTAFLPLVQSHPCRITYIALPSGISAEQERTIMSAASSLPLAIQTTPISYWQAYLCSISLADFTDFTDFILLLQFIPTQCTASLVYSYIDEDVRMMSVQDERTYTHGTVLDDPSEQAKGIMQEIAKTFFLPGLKRIVLANPVSTLAKSLESLFTATDSAVPTSVSVHTASPADLSTGSAICARRYSSRPVRIRTLATHAMPVALSVATADGGVIVAVPEGYKLRPVDETVLMTTAVDNQSSVTVHLALGNHSRAKENLARGTVVLEGLHPMPKGIARISITFVIGPETGAHVTVEQVVGDELRPGPKKVVRFPDLLKNLGNDYERYIVQEGPSATHLDDSEQISGELPE